jgi:hypothetical protein
MCRDAARFMRACESMTPEASAILGKALEAAQRRPRHRPSYWLVLVAVFTAAMMPSPFEKDAAVYADLSFMRPFVNPYSPIFRAGVLNNRICRGAHIKHKMSYAPRCGRPTPNGIIVPVEF